MKIFGLAGWSGSGKTTLMVRLLPEITSRGLSVSTMKHAHHSFEIDSPGKDSWEHRTAGAREVLLTSTRRWVLMHENDDAPEPPVEELVGRMTPVDLLLIEGFKTHDHPKVEVHRPALGKPLLCHEDAHVVAVASDAGLAGLHIPVLDLNDAAAIAGFILTRCGLGSEARHGAA